MDDEPSLLSVRPLTPDERVVQSDDPRPGIWFGDREADGRELSQGDTDVLIRAELVTLTDGKPEQAELLAVIGGTRASHATPPLGVRDRMAHVTRQRGGLDTDPLVRVLAYRAWGDRDRRWFVERGVRTGDLVALVAGVPPSVALAWRGEPELGVAVADAAPGCQVAVRLSAPSEVDVWTDTRRRNVFSTFPVSDRPRTDPTSE